MTLENLKDYWQTISLKHKDVQQCNVGSYYDAATNTSDKYPLSFIEMPFSINMNLQKPIDTIQFSFSIFLATKQDDIKDDVEAISIAKAIGDAIILYAANDKNNNDFTLDSVNGVSVREYSDDYVAGIRYDLTLTVKRDICDLSEYFNEVIS